MARNGMYPASRRRLNSLMMPFGVSSSGAGYLPPGATALLRSPVDESNYAAPSPQCGGGTSPGNSNSVQAAPSSLPYAASPSPTSSAQRGLQQQQQQKQADAYPRGGSGAVAGAPGLQRYAPPSQHSGDKDDNNSLFNYEDATGSQQQPFRNATATVSDSSGGGQVYATAYPSTAYPSTEEYTGVEVDSADAEAANTASYYQQCYQYYQYQLYCQQQQQAAAASSCGRRNDRSSYRYTPATNNPGEAYADSEAGGLGEGGAVLADASSSPATPSYTGAYGQHSSHSHHNHGRFYCNPNSEANESGGSGAAPTYAMRGRGPASWSSGGRTDTLDNAVGTAGGGGGGGGGDGVSAAAAAGAKHTRTVSRTDSANGSATASSTDALVGYAGGGEPHSTSSGRYPSPHHTQNVYSTAYDSQTAPLQQQQQYYNAYGSQTMAGGYGAYYNTGAGCRYNPGYYAGMTQPQRQLPYPRGNSRGAYAQTPYAAYTAYGYGAPYDEQQYGNYVSVGGASTTARRDAQPLQPTQSQQQYQQEDYPANVEDAPFDTSNVSQQPSGALQNEDDARERSLKEEAESEEPLMTARVQPPPLPLAATPKSAAAGESKSVVRKKKKAAAAAAAAAAASAEEVAKTTKTIGSISKATAAKQTGVLPKASDKGTTNAAEGALSGAVAKAALEAAGPGTAVACSTTSHSSTIREARATTADTLAFTERTSPAEKHTPSTQLQHAKATVVKKVTDELSKVDKKSLSAAEDMAKTVAGAAVTAAAQKAVDTAPTKGLHVGPAVISTIPTSGSSDLVRSSSGAQARPASPAHGAARGNSPSTTQRFLRHSPLTQCVGGPFHTYLNGAMVGQAAHMQPLPPSAAAAAAAAADNSECGAGVGGGNAATADAGIASSNASLSTCSSQAIPAIYAPVQRLLPHRTASANAEEGGEAVSQHNDSQHGDDDNVDDSIGDGGNWGSRVLHRESNEDAQKGVAEGVDGIDEDNDSNTSQQQQRRRSSQRRGETLALQRDLLVSTEKVLPRLGGAAAFATATPTSSCSTRSAVGVRPHHMHHFAHHGAQQQQRPESPQASGVPQHLHAYRHTSPSPQPVSITAAATASTTSDPYAQSLDSAALLPPRSPAGVGPTSSPLLRGRGAGPSIRPTALSNHVTSTSTGPNLPVVAAEGCGAVSTMQQQQQHVSPYPQSARAHSQAGGNGYSKASGAETAEVCSAGCDDASPYAGGGSDSGQRGELVSSSYPATTHQQQQQQPHLSGGGGSGRCGGYRTTPSPSMGSSAPPGPAGTASGSAAKVGGQTSAAHSVPPAVGALTPNAEPQLPVQQGPVGTNVGANGRDTPSPRGSVHANSPQHSQYSPRNQYVGAGTNISANGGISSNNGNGASAVQANGGFPVLPQQPGYIYEHHIGQEVLLEKFHSAMRFNALSFGNIACLVNAFSPQVPIVSDLEFPCDEERCQLLRPPGIGGGPGTSAEERGLCSPGGALGPNSSHGSGFGSRGGGASLHFEDTTAPTLMSLPPCPNDADRSHYWDFDGPSYCEPVVALKSIWQSFDSPFGCVVNLAEPIYPAPMRPAEEELVYTPLLSGFRIRFHPASPAYKRLAAIREVRRQRRREESGAAGAGDGGGADSATACSTGSKEAAATSYAEEDGVLTWSAADRPNNRNIILEQITELARCDESYAELLTATSADVDHQSWVALMWQPVFCGGHSAKHSCGTFLAFYLLRAPRHLFLPFANKSEGAAMNSSWSSPVFRGDRAALSFDLWSLQRYYHIARWAPSPPTTHVTTTLSVVGEEDDNASSVSASRGRLSWEDGPVGCASNVAESCSMSNNGDSRVRPRELTSRSFVEGTAPTYVRVPLVGLIPNRCRPDVWFKAIYDTNQAVNAHRNININGNGGNGGNGGSSGGTLFYHAPLFLMVTALQLMCWDAFSEWRRKPTAVTPSAPSAPENREAEAEGVVEDTDAAADDGEPTAKPIKKTDSPADDDDDDDGGGGESRPGTMQLQNPLTDAVEQELSFTPQPLRQKQRGAGVGGNGEAGMADASGGQEEAVAERRSRQRPPSAARNDSAAWVPYFAEGVEVMTDAARRYRAVRELANLDAAVEDGASAMPAAASPVSAATRLSGEALALPAGGNGAEDKKGVVEEETLRPVGRALVAGGTNSSLCDPAARVIAGLLDYYQWAQYDVALNGLARVYCSI